jgi:hypothetical protein
VAIYRQQSALVDNAVDRRWRASLTSGRRSSARSRVSAGPAGGAHAYNEAIGPQPAAAADAAAAGSAEDRPRRGGRSRAGAADTAPREVGQPTYSAARRARVAGRPGRISVSEPRASNRFRRRRPSSASAWLAASAWPGPDGCSRSRRRCRPDGAMSEVHCSLRDSSRRLPATA